MSAADKYKSNVLVSFTWFFISTFLLIPGILLSVFSGLEVHDLREKKIDAPVLFLHFILSVLATTVVAIIALASLVIGLINLSRLVYAEAVEAAKQEMPITGNYKPCDCGEV